MKGEHAGRRNLVTQVLQLLDAPHALLRVYHQPVVLKSLQDLPHVDNVLLMVPAEDDNIIRPGKGGLAVSNSPVHVPLEGQPRIPQTKRHPLVLEQAEGGGYGGLLHVRRIHRDLVVPLPKVDLGEDGAARRLGGEVQHVGKRVHIWLCNQVQPPEIPARPPAPVRLPTMCRGLDQGDVER